MALLVKSALKNVIYWIHASASAIAVVDIYMICISGTDIEFIKMLALNVLILMSLIYSAKKQNIIVFLLKRIFEMALCQLKIRQIRVKTILYELL